MRERASKSLRSRLFVGAVACVGVLALTQCKSDSTAPVKVAATDLAAPVNSSVVKAVEGQTFSFSDGGAFAPALAGQPLTMAFTNTSSAAPTATIVVGGVTYVATTTFGSCIFTFSTAFFGQLVWVINPCSFIVGTAGIPANGQTTNMTLLFRLGSGSSVPITLPGAINPDGSVTLNGVEIGTVTVTNATGGA
ncbi:MAG: hypothetical protein O2973_12175 [Gemmatimonadetes bacterium]|nr:hypothetical protein [Gemmatimonadota bacterium]